MDNADRPNRFGQRLRALRKQAGMTLAQLATASGISTANISKTENGRISPTYDVLEKLARGLGITLSDLVSTAADASPEAILASGRLSITRHDQPVSISSDQYDYTYLAADLKSKQLVPILMRLKAGSIETFGKLMTHGGEEFIYVLTGRVEVHTTHYQPITLETGDSVYLDSRMGHASIRSGQAPAIILTVATEPAPVASTMKYEHKSY